MNLKELENLLLVLVQFGVTSYKDSNCSIQINSQVKSSNTNEDYSSTKQEVELDPKTQELLDSIPKEYREAFSFRPKP